jgi:hypothetical protein
MSYIHTYIHINLVAILEVNLKFLDRENNGFIALTKLQILDFPSVRGILLMTPNSPKLKKNFIVLLFILHTMLGSFLPHAPTPSLTTHSAPSLFPPTPQYLAETILPLSLILLKRV